jgi:dipeptidyl-peptidase-4
MDYVDNAKWQI